jgi:hypothetical protein
VRACACVRVRARACACVRVRACACVRARTHVTVLCVSDVTVMQHNASSARVHTVSVEHDRGQPALAAEVCQGRLGWGVGVWGFEVWGLGFGVWGLGFGVWGFGFGVWGLGFDLVAAINFSNAAREHCFRAAVQALRWSRDSMMFGCKRAWRSARRATSESGRVSREGLGFNKAVANVSQRRAHLCPGARGKDSEIAGRQMAG